MQTFRTPNEAVELANNTGFGLAACVWSESISLALEIAPRIKAGVVWINTANQFDASCGFGGQRESGFGREGGREGLREYLKPRKTAMSARRCCTTWQKTCKRKPAALWPWSARLKCKPPWSACLLLPPGPTNATALCTSRRSTA